jgi:hypothetical protein
MKAIASTTKQKVNNRAGRRRVDPTSGFIASLEVGLRATVGTLQGRYPYIQALSQDKLQDVHPHTVMCPTASDLTSQLRWAPTLPHVLWL